jgi:hypothetical protein
LLRTQRLELLDVPEWDARTPFREVYVSEEFWTWVNSNDYLHEHLIGRRTIYEHIEAMLLDFRCANRPPGGSELRRMNPHPDGVYRLSPAGSRVYGWMPEPNCLVVVCADTEKAFKSDRSLYETHRQRVVQFRKDHGVDVGYVTGDYRALFTS